MHRRGVVVATTLALGLVAAVASPLSATGAYKSTVTLKLHGALVAHGEVRSQDSALRPTDYEFDPALSPTSEIEPRESLTSGFSARRRPTLCNVSQSVAGPMRDTSRA